MSTPLSEKKLITKTQSKLALFLMLGVGAVISINGLMDMFYNPQVVTAQEKQQIYERGYDRKPVVRVKDRSSSANGSIKVLAGAAIAIVGTSIFANEKPKLDAQYQSVLPEQRRSDAVVQESRQKAIVDEIRKDLLNEYLAKVLIECPWIESCLESQAIFCIGEGGAGKSRTAMCIALCQFIWRGTYGSTISVVDTQGAKNLQDGTWIAGTVYGSHNKELIQFIKGKDRTNATPFDVLVVDEAGKLSADPIESEIILEAMTAAKTDTRKGNRCIIFCSHSVMKDELGGDRMTGVRSPLLKAAKVFYFPATKDRRGRPSKADVVFSRNGFNDHDECPRRIGDSTQFEGTRGWEMHTIPKWLDPSEFARQLHAHIIALGAIARPAPSPVETRKIDPEILDHLAAQVHPQSAIVAALEGKPESGTDTGVTNLERLESAFENSDIHDDFDKTIKPVVITQERLDELTGEHKSFIEARHKSSAKEINGAIVLDTRKVYQNWGKRRFESQGKTEAFKRFLARLEGDRLGVLSKSAKYWIHPSISE